MSGGGRGRTPVLLVTMLLTALVGAGVAGAGAARGNGLSTCVEREGHVSVLLLVDESQSLRRTDADAARVDGLRAAVSALVPADRDDATVSLRLAGFGTEFRTYGGWTDIPADGPDALETELLAFAERDDDLDTDYHEALDGVASTLDQRLRERDGRTCPVVVWFTDGEYDLDSSAVRQYAPDLDPTTEDGRAAIVERGRRELCAQGGIVDRLRAQGTAMFVVALGLVDPRDQRFLEAVATGHGGDLGCGDPALAGEGLVVLVDETDRLIDAFHDALRPGTTVEADDDILVCDGAVCELGTRTFDVDASLGGFALLLGADRPGVQAHIVAPASTAPAVLDLGASGRVSLGGLILRADGLSDRVSVVDVSLSDGDRSWAGTWSVTFVSPEAVGGTARLQLRVIPGFLSELADDELHQGEPVTLRGSVVSRGGQPLPDGIGAEVLVTASLSEPGGVGTVDLVVDGPNELGKFSLEGGALDLTSSSVDVLVTTAVVLPNGAELVPIETTHRIVVRPPSSLRLPRVDGELDFGLIEGSEPARGSISVTADDAADGRVCVVRLTIVTAPTVAEPFDSEATGTCVDVAPGSTSMVPVDLRPADEARGPLEGRFDLELTSAATNEVTTVAVPFRASMLPMVDEGLRRALVAALLLVGLAVPVAFLWLLERTLAKLPTSGRIMVVRLPVTRDGEGVLATASGVDPAELDGRYLDHEHARHAEHSRLRLEARPRLVGFPYARASSDEATVVTGRSDADHPKPTARLPLNLTGSWAAIVHDGPTASAELYLFTDAEPGWRDRAQELLDRAFEELAVHLSSAEVTPDTVAREHEPPTDDRAWSTAGWTTERARANDGASSPEGSGRIDPPSHRTESPPWGSDTDGGSAEESPIAPEDDPWF